MEVAFEAQGKSYPKRQLRQAFGLTPSLAESCLFSSMPKKKRNLSIHPAFHMHSKHRSLSLSLKKEKKTANIPREIFMIYSSMDSVSIIFS